MTPPRDEPASLSIRAAAGVVRPALNLLMGKQWDGMERLPRGGYIVVANHVTEIDPFAVAHAVYNGGSTPHFLAKDSLFSLPVLGGMLHRLQQIPVARNQREAQGSLERAREVLADGGAIIIYPEGTLTRDPQLWPMRAKTGAARLALNTGAPVIPITHWGVQDLLAPYGKVPKVLPRRRYRLCVGEEVELSDLRERPRTRQVLAQATERIEDALTAGVGALRGEEPPELIWDRALRQRVPRRQVEEG
ncbi:lysophospholipid acyltransferase family protein [Nesterenkonia suensis]